MLLKMFCIYDAKVEAYMTPFFMRSKGEAIRGFTELVNDGKSNFAKYPADFTLFELGDWNDGACAFGLHPAPIVVCVGVELVSNEPTV